MGNKKHNLINFNGSLRTGLEGAATLLSIGEIAVVTGDKLLATKDSDGTIHYFIDSAATETAINNIITGITAGKIDKVAGATVGNLVQLTANGQIADSNTKISDFVAAEAGKRLATNEEIAKLKHIASGATKVEESAQVDNKGYLVINGTTTKIYEDPSDTVIDANYKHVTVESNKITRDNLELLKSDVATRLKISDIDTTVPELSAGSSVEEALNYLYSVAKQNLISIDTENNDILNLTDGYVLESTVSLEYADKKILLKGAGGKTIGTIDASAFLADKMIQSVSDVDANDNITITWNFDEGGAAKTTPINLKRFINAYTNGHLVNVAKSTNADGKTVYTIGLNLNQDNPVTDASGGIMTGEQANDALGKYVDRTTTIADLPLTGDISGTALTPKLREASDTEKGLMSKEDYTKLVSVADGAESNVLINFKLGDVTTATGNKTQSGVKLSSVDPDGNDQTIFMDLNSLVVDCGGW